MKTKFKHKSLRLIAPPLLYLLFRLLWLTTRKRFHLLQPVSPTQTYIGICWHSELLMSPQGYYKLRPKAETSAIIDPDFNGELIAKLLSFLKISAIRGSSRKGATSALLAAFRLLKGGTSVLITPDGPHGPRYHMSDGVAALAIKAKLPVLTVNYMPQHYWKCRGWDHFVIPKPFCRIDFYFQEVRLENKNLEEAKGILLKMMSRYRLP